MHTFLFILIILMSACVVLAPLPTPSGNPEVLIPDVKKEDVINKIARLEGRGGSYISAGLEIADKTLGNVEKGNIILISDGISGGMVKAQGFAEDIYKREGKIVYGIGVGDPCIKYNSQTGKCDKWTDDIYGSSVCTG